MYPLLEIYLIDTWMTVEAAAVGALNQSEANLKTGTLSLVWDIADVPSLGKDDAVAVRVKQDAEDAGTVIFSGKITDRQSNGTTVSYTASNVLNDLQRILMVVNGETKFNLFRDASGTAITIGQQIAAALDYAAAQGIAVTYDQDEIDALDLDMPATEVSDITVYEIIKKALIYRSDIIVAVEYAAPGSDSIVRLVNQADLETETLVIGTDIATYSAKALYDRQIEGVVLTYKWTDYDSEGAATLNTEVDSHGTITGVNVLRQAVELIGTDHRKDIVVVNRPLSDGTGDWIPIWNFWKNAIVDSQPQLAGVTWNVGAWSGNLPYEGDTYNSGGGTHLILKSQYDNASDEIRSKIGQVFDPDCHADKVYSYHIPGQNYQWFQNLYITSVAPPGYPFALGAGWWLPFYAFAPNATFSYSFNPDEVPAGLAEQLYNILSPLQHDGQVVCYNDLTTPARICSILRKLNIAGADDDLETMAAIVQKCGIDLLSLIRTDTFGVASHLEPQDFIALCRANKTIGNLRLA